MTSPDFSESPDSAVSGMSSPFGGSEMSTSGGTEAGGLDRTSFWVVGICCFILLGLGLVVVLATFVGNVDVDDANTDEQSARGDGGSGGGGGSGSGSGGSGSGSGGTSGGGGGQPSIIVIPRTTPVVPTRPHLSTPAGVKTKVTPPPRPVPPLLCSVGTIATAVKTLLPPDGDCDILMFAHVHVVNQTVHSLVSDMSLRTFEATCASYTQTTCGLSFSIWMLKNDTFSDLVVQDTLKDLQKRNNINHLGILDLQGTREEIDMAGVTIVPAVLAAMRHHLGHNSEENKIVLGLGYYYYDHPEAWSQLSRTGLSLAAKDVDVLVVISTVVSIPSQSSCLTLPSNALMSEDRHTPNMEGASIMARDSFGRSSVIVAFALQMGVITYTMTDTHDHANDALYKNCTGFGITDYSQACQVSGEELGTAKTMISLNNNASVSLFNRTINRTMFQTFDTAAQMKDKAKVIMNKPERRANFSWFLFNVELTDVTGHCLPEGPFDRLKQFKEFYVNEARNGPPT